MKNDNPYVTNDGPQQGCLPERYIRVLLAARECGADPVELRQIGFILCRRDVALLRAFENWLVANGE
jgi:hypothetical protein